MRNTKRRFYPRIFFIALFVVFIDFIIGLLGNILGAGNLSPMLIIGAVLIIIIGALLAYGELVREKHPTSILDEKSFAQSLLTFLENRRILFTSTELERPEIAIESIQTIRKRLTSELEKLDRSTSLAKSIERAQIACRNFLDRVQTLPHLNKRVDVEWISGIITGHQRSVPISDRLDFKELARQYSFLESDPLAWKDVLTFIGCVYEIRIIFNSFIQYLIQTYQIDITNYLYLASHLTEEQHNYIRDRQPSTKQERARVPHVLPPTELGISPPQSLAIPLVNAQPPSITEIRSASVSPEETGFPTKGQVHSMLGLLTSKPSIFLYYSRADAYFADRLIRTLKEFGIKTFWEHMKLIDLTPEWEVAIKESFQLSNAIILIASPDFARSEAIHVAIQMLNLTENSIYAVWAKGTDFASSVPIGYENLQFWNATNNNTEHEIFMKVIMTIIEDMMTKDK